MKGSRMNDLHISDQTTPQEITPTIRDFCREIDAAATPAYVPVRPDRNCVPSECYQNVANKIRRKGGGERQGRIIWESPGLHLEAEHHAIWISKAGVAIDITPKEDGEERILFLPSSRTPYDGSQLIAPIHKPLTDDPSTEFTTNLAMDAFDEKNRLFKQGLLVKPRVWKNSPAVKVGRNDLCPCGSGRKFKKCCMN